MLHLSKNWNCRQVVRGMLSDFGEFSRAFVRGQQLSGHINSIGPEVTMKQQAELGIEYNGLLTFVGQA